MQGWRPLGILLAAACAAGPASGGDAAGFDRGLELARERYAKCLIRAEDEAFACHQACLKDPKRPQGAQEKSSYEVRTCYGFCERRMDEAMGECQKARAAEEARIELDRKKALRGRGT